MKIARFKYYDYFILSFMINFWMCGICGMEQHKADAGTSFSAVATAAAINLNPPTRITASGSPTQKNSREYSQV